MPRIYVPAHFVCNNAYVSQSVAALNRMKGAYCTPRASRRRLGPVRPGPESNRVQSSPRDFSCRLDSSPLLRVNTHLKLP